MVRSAAVALARRHNTPMVKMTANGGAMKKKTVWIFSKSVVVGLVNEMAIQMLASNTMAPLQRPKRNCLASGTSRFINFLYRSMGMILEREFSTAGACDMK